MSFLLRAAVLAGIGLSLWVSSAQAGPFGLFTRSTFQWPCIYCGCEKPYNAFTPPGYNPLIHRAYPAASAPVMGSHMIGNGTLGGPVPVSSGGCSSCGLSAPVSGPLQPIAAGAIPHGVLPPGAIPLGVVPVDSLPLTPVGLPPQR